MGNPAGERLKKKEKRRKKLEQRLKIGRYAESTESADKKEKKESAPQSAE